MVAAAAGVVAAVAAAAVAAGAVVTAAGRALAAAGAVATGAGVGRPEGRMEDTSAAEAPDGAAPNKPPSRPDGAGVVAAAAAGRAVSTPAAGAAVGAPPKSAESPDAPEAAGAAVAGAAPGPAANVVALGTYGFGTSDATEAASDRAGVAAVRRPLGLIAAGIADAARDGRGEGVGEITRARVSFTDRTGAALIGQRKNRTSHHLGRGGAPVAGVAVAAPGSAQLKVPPATGVGPCGPGSTFRKLWRAAQSRGGDQMSHGNGDREAERTHIGRPNWSSVRSACVQPRRDAHCAAIELSRRQVGR